MTTTLRASLRLDVNRSTPTRHFFHTESESGSAGLDEINERLVASKQMYVRFDEDAVDMCIAGTPDEIRAWAQRLTAYVDEATGSVDGADNQGQPVHGDKVPYHGARSDLLNGATKAVGCRECLTPTTDPTGRCDEHQAVGL